MPSVAMLVTPEGEWVPPDAPEFAAPPGAPDRAEDRIAHAIIERGFIRLQLIQDAVVEIELYPRLVKLPALLAVQQQLQSTEVSLFRIKYFDTAWQSEICSSVEPAIARLSELCAPVFTPGLSDLYTVEPKDIAEVFDDREHHYRPLAQKWRVSFGRFDPSVIAVAVQNDLLPSLTVVGVRPFEPDPVFRFIGQGQEWIGSHVARVGERVGEQPDRDYGRWLGEYYRFVASSKQPRYDLVRARLQVQDEGGRSRRTVCFERLLLPWKTSSHEVFVTSCTTIVGAPMQPDAGSAASAGA